MMAFKNQIHSLSEIKRAGVLAFAIGASVLTTLVRADDRHWYLQQGKGRPLCERLVRIANANPTKGITPNIPWAQVLAIKGVREPEWKELDPAAHEKLFLMVREFMASHARNLPDEQVIPFARWFKVPKERYISDAVLATPISDDAALEMYRDFVRRGGKLKVLRHDMGDEMGSVPKDIVQYESPETDLSDWDGYSVEAAPDLSAIPDAGYQYADLGRGYRILRYKNNVLSFVGFGRRDYDEYRVEQLGGEQEIIAVDQGVSWTGYCKINSKTIKIRKRK